MPNDEKENAEQEQKEGFWERNVTKGVKKGLKSGLSAIGGSIAQYSVPAAPNVDDLEKKVLDDALAKDIIDKLEVHGQKLKRLQGDLSNYGRVATNFVNHVVKELSNYRSIITSCIRGLNANTITKYKEKLDTSLGKMFANCENSNIKNLTYKNYEDHIKDNGMTFIGTGGIYLIGDFASRLSECIKGTRDAIVNLDDSDLLSKICGKEKKEISKTGRFKQMFKEKLGNIARKKDALSNAVSGFIDDFSDTLLRATGKKMNLFNQVLPPVEYYPFPKIPDSDLNASDKELKHKDWCLSISLVHSIENILKSYSKTTQMYYPDDLDGYVKQCDKCTKILSENFNKYESSLQMFSKSAIAFEQKVKIKAKIAAILGNVIGSISNLLENKKEKTVGWIADLKEPDKGGGYNTGVRVGLKEENPEYLIGGWSFGHFLKFMMPCIVWTKNNLKNLVNLENDTIAYDAFKIKAPSVKKSKKSSAEDGKTTKKTASTLDLEKVLKFYIDTLEKAKDVFVSVEKVKAKADSVCQSIVPRGTTFEKNDTSTKAKCKRRYDELADVKHKALQTEYTNKFEDVESYDEFKDAKEEVKKLRNANNSSDKNPVIKYDMAKKKRLVDKDMARKVVEQLGAVGKDTRAFVERLAGDFRSFKSKCSDMATEFSNYINFYKGYKGEPSDEPKNGKRRAQKTK